MGEARENSATELDRLRAQSVEAYARGDAEAASALYVEDGVQQPPGRPASVGRDAIRESYRALFARGALTLRMDPWETIVSGREGRERGAYHLAAGDRTLLMGKYMIVVAKADDDEWRYAWTTVTPD